MNQDLIKAIVQFFGGLVATTAILIKFLGDMIARKDKKQSDRILTLEEQVKHNRELIENEVKFMREKAASDQASFQQRLKDVTDYMSNRPR